MNEFMEERPIILLAALEPLPSRHTDAIFIERIECLGEAVLDCWPLRHVRHDFLWFGWLRYWFGWMAVLQTLALREVEDEVVAEKRDFPLFRGILGLNGKPFPEYNGTRLFAFLHRPAKHIGLTVGEPEGRFVVHA